MSVFTKCRKLLRGLEDWMGEILEFFVGRTFFSAKKEIYYLVLRK